MSKNIINATKVSALAIVISFGLSYALAWTAPTQTPPLGNVSAPINTGSGAQTKAGALTVGGLTITTGGSLRIPTGAGVNKVLTSDALGNVTWQNTQTYTPGNAVYTLPGTHTFTVPPLTTILNMEVWGGGGGSGSNTYGWYTDGDYVDHGAYTGGGGGGSGGRAGATNIPVTPGQEFTIQVGAGGLGGTQGGWEYSSSFVLPQQTYGANGGPSYVSHTPQGGVTTVYAVATGGAGGRNYDGKLPDWLTVYCGAYYGATPYSAPGGIGTVTGNPGGNCTNTDTGSNGGAALLGTNPFSPAGAGGGGGPNPVGPQQAVGGKTGKVVLWW